LTLVFGQQRACGIKVVFFNLWVIGQGVKLATQWFTVTQFASLFAQIFALILNAQMAKHFGFFLSEGNFEWAIA
jgi:hypothetical protein